MTIKDPTVENEVPRHVKKRGKRKRYGFVSERFSVWQNRMFRWPSWYLTERQRDQAMAAEISKYERQTPAMRKLLGDLTFFKQDRVR